MPETFSLNPGGNIIFDPATGNVKAGKKAKAKKKKVSLKPIKCFNCGTFTGEFAPKGSPKLFEKSCGCLDSSKIDASLTNDRVTAHRAEADARIASGEDSHDVLGCERCNAPMHDECVCCEACHMGPQHTHNGHKYVPKGKNIKAQMG